jgi:hypothetical protein
LGRKLFIFADILISDEHTSGQADKHYAPKVRYECSIRPKKYSRMKDKVLLLPELRQALAWPVPRICPCGAYLSLAA